MKIAFAAAACLAAMLGAAQAAPVDRSVTGVSGPAAIPVAASCGRHSPRSKAYVRCLDRRAAAAERRAAAAERRAAAAEERVAERRHRRYREEDEGGPYGPTLTNDYYFQQSIYDFQDGKKANLKEYK